MSQQDQVLGMCMFSVEQTTEEKKKHRVEMEDGNSVV